MKIPGTPRRDTKKGDLFEHPGERTMLAIQSNKDGRPIMLQSLNAATSAPPSPPLAPEEDLNADPTCHLSCFSAVKVDETHKGN